MANDNKERIGIVGTGRMGLAMLKHLVKRGYTVTACDVSAKALETARAAGGATADTPAALAKQCDFVILGVGYTDEINAVVYGEGGLIANLARGAIIAVSSTTSPATVQQIAKDAGPRGIGVLDAPIWLHPDDLMLWRQVYPDREPDRPLVDGQELQVGDIKLRAMHTPGHSPGGVSLYDAAGKMVFSGDTLFKGGPGATGRSFSDFPTIIESIRERLLTLPDDTRVLPGHGEETTIGDEGPGLAGWLARGH